MYRDTLLALSKDVRFRSSEKLPTPVSERRNPACGDEIALDWQVEDGKMMNLRFYAQGCAVSVASAAAMCAELEGQDLQSAQERIEQALAFFDSEAEWTADWGTETVPALGAVRERPMRMACVRLPWEAMHEKVNEV
jgi:nitrogen fixation NifU-like protein